MREGSAGATAQHRATCDMGDEGTNALAAKRQGQPGCRPWPTSLGHQGALARSKQGGDGGRKGGFGSISIAQAQLRCDSPWICWVMALQTVYRWFSSMRHCVLVLWCAPQGGLLLAPAVGWCYQALPPPVYVLPFPAPHIETQLNISSDVPPLLLPPDPMYSFSFPVFFPQCRCMPGPLPNPCGAAGAAPM